MGLEPTISIPYLELCVLITPSAGIAAINRGLVKYICNNALHFLTIHMTEKNPMQNTMIKTTITMLFLFTDISISKLTFKAMR